MNLPFTKLTNDKLKLYKGKICACSCFSLILKKNLEICVLNQKEQNNLHNLIVYLLIYSLEIRKILKIQY